MNRTKKPDATKDSQDMQNAVLQLLRDKFPPSVQVNQNKQVQDMRFDFLLVDETTNWANIIECRLNRKNIDYYIGQMPLYREKLLQDKGRGFFPVSIETVELAIALPKKQVNYNLEKKLAQAKIELISVDIEIEQPVETNIYIKLVQGTDDDLIEWLENVPEQKRQTRVKEVLRDHQKMKIDLITQELTDIRKQLSKLTDMIESSKRGG